MCRLIFAHGQFDAKQVMLAAADMSCGKTADHDSPIKVHPNGWGAVWCGLGGDSSLQMYQSAQALCAGGLEDSPLWGAGLGMLALHARHATMPTKLGLEFAHPLVRQGSGGTWYFMHNGYTPTMHSLLGKTQSHFDSLDYFEYLIDPDAADIDCARALRKLEAVPEGGSAANAIAINGRCAHLVHFVFPTTRFQRYFQMYRLTLPSGEVYASEVLPQLAPKARWEALESQQIFKVNF